MATIGVQHLGHQKHPILDVVQVLHPGVVQNHVLVQFLNQEKRTMETITIKTIATTTVTGRQYQIDVDLERHLLLDLAPDRQVLIATIAGFFVMSVDEVEEDQTVSHLVDDSIDLYPIHHQECERMTMVNFQDVIKGVRDQLHVLLRGHQYHTETLYRAHLIAQFSSIIVGEGHHDRRLP